MAKELDAPPAVHTDPDSFELLRLWAAHEQQHVSIRSDLNGGAWAFGQMLAHLAQHGARMYAEQEGTAPEPQLRAILRGFVEECEDPSGDVSGSIARDD